MKIKGKAWNYGNNVNTDFILPGIYLELTDPREMAKHAMEGIDPEFVKNVQPGDIVVGGKNFGLGSSREHAPLALKYAGISAVVAESFARIFYRNAANIGLLVLECKGISTSVKTKDLIEIDLTLGTICINEKEKLIFQPMPDFMAEILNAGGLVSYIKRYRNKW